MNVEGRKVPVTCLVSGKQGGTRLAWNCVGGENLFRARQHCRERAFGAACSAYPSVYLTEQGASAVSIEVCWPIDRQRHKRIDPTNSALVNPSMKITQRDFYT